MKKLDHIIQTSKLPDDFFENQVKLIGQKTIELENWNIPGTKNYEQYFPLNANYWLQMERELHQKIHNPKFQIAPDWLPFKPAYALSFLTCALLLCIWGIYLLKKPEGLDPNLFSRIETTDLMAYTEAAGITELQEYNELLTSEDQALTELTIPFQIPENSADEFTSELNQTEHLFLPTDSF